MYAAPGHVIASCFALSAFVVGLISGLAAQNPAVTVLVRAMLAMVICYPFGVIVGAVCERAIARHVASKERRVDFASLDASSDDDGESAEIFEGDEADGVGDPAGAGVAEQTQAA